MKASHPYSKLFSRSLQVFACGGALFLTLSCVTTANPQNLWSPEYAQLLFMSRQNGNAEIYIQPGIDGEWTNLTHSRTDENWPQWSPDGRWIVYQRNQDDNLDIWVMAADGSNSKQLTFDRAHDYLPSWTPDGTSITFASWRTAPGDVGPAVHIYIMNADGSNQRRLVAESPGLSASPAWSPDGNGFVLAKRVGRNGADLFLYDADGNELRQLTDDACFNGAPVFSPDSQHIAFHCSDKDHSEIVVMSRAGDQRQVLVGDGRNWYPRWSPDGRWLTYTTTVPDGPDGNFDIMAIQVTGSDQPVRLVSGPSRDVESSWQPTQPADFQ